MKTQLSEVIEMSKRTYEDASKEIGNTPSWLRNYKRQDFSGKIKERYIDFIEWRSLKTLEKIKLYKAWQMKK